MVYGDFGFCLVVVMAKPARRWSRRELGDWDFVPGAPRIGIWPRLISGTFALIMVKGASFGAFAVSWVLRREVSASRAGSRRGAPG
jgi:hypothetical protein